MKRFTLFLLVLCITATAATAGSRQVPQCKVTSVPAGLDFCLTGQVGNLFEIPGSGGAWALGIFRTEPGIEEFLDLFCDREQPVTAICAERVELFDRVELCGKVRSNEPNSGQRLSIRTITFLGNLDDSQLDPPPWYRAGMYDEYNRSLAPWYGDLR